MLQRLSVPLETAKKDNMKRCIFTICMNLLALCVMAQYYAYSINGEVQIMRNGNWQNVYSSMELQASDLVKTSEYGNLTILDRTNNKIYSIQTTNAQALEQLIQNTQRKTQKLSIEYIQGMFNKLFGYEDARTESMQTIGGVTYRGEEEDRNIAGALVNSAKSSYPVSFLLLDLQTMAAVENVQNEGTYILQMNNMSDTPLYMNIIYTDEKGETSAMLPLDENQTMLHLYIPAFSNVRLTEFPLSFTPPGVINWLTLVASPMLFNLQSVIHYMQSPELQQTMSTSASSHTIGRYDMKLRIED